MPCRLRCQVGARPEGARGGTTSVTAETTSAAQRCVGTKLTWLHKNATHSCAAATERCLADAEVGGGISGSHPSPAKLRCASSNGMPSLASSSSSRVRPFSAARQVAGRRNMEPAGTQPSSSLCGTPGGSPPQAGPHLCRFAGGRRHRGCSSWPHTGSTPTAAQSGSRLVACRHAAEAAREREERPARHRCIRRQAQARPASTASWQAGPVQQAAHRMRQVIWLFSTVTPSPSATSRSAGTSRWPLLLT